LGELISQSATEKNYKPSYVSGYQTENGTRFNVIFEPRPAQYSGTGWNFSLSKMQEKTDVLSEDASNTFYRFINCYDRGNGVPLTGCAFGASNNR